MSHPRLKTLFAVLQGSDTHAVELFLSLWLIAWGVLTFVTDHDALNRFPIGHEFLRIAPKWMWASTEIILGSLKLWALLGPSRVHRQIVAAFICAFWIFCTAITMTVLPTANNVPAFLCAALSSVWIIWRLT